MQETQVRSPGSGRSPGGGHGNPCLYSCLENPMDRVAWWAAVHGVPRVRHDIATKQQQSCIHYIHLKILFVNYLSPQLYPWYMLCISWNIHRNRNFKSMKKRVINTGLNVYCVFYLHLLCLEDILRQSLYQQSKWFCFFRNLLLSVTFNNV